MIPPAKLRMCADLSAPEGIMGYTDFEGRLRGKDDVAATKAFIQSFVPWVGRIVDLRTLKHFGFCGEERVVFQRP